MHPRPISVVIPAYRHERFVGEAIDSVRDQTFPARELVVVDDGSPDSTAEVVEAHSFPALRLMRQENRGAHAALNRGIAEATGRWIAILNSDDRYRPQHLEEGLGVAESSGALLLFGSVALIDGTGAALGSEHPTARWYREARASGSAASLPEALRTHNLAVTTSNFLFHRALWEALGGFGDLRYVHDLDFLLRAVELVPDRVCFEPSLQGVEYRVHGSNTITEDVDRALDERRSLLRALDRPLPRAFRKLRAIPDRRGVERAVAEPEVSAARPSEGTAVGIVVRELDAGGLEEMVALLAAGLSDTGFAPHILCTERGGEVGNRLRSMGIPVEEGFGRPSRWAEWAESVRPRVVSSHYADPDALKLLADFAPIVEVVHNCYAWFGARDWAVEAEKASRVRGVVAVSPLVERYYLAHCPEARSLGVIPNAVAPDHCLSVPREYARRSLEVEDRDRLLVHLGRIAEQKNLFGLLDAFTEVVAADRRAVLVLAGPTSAPGYQAEIERRYRRLIASGRVRLPGPVSAVGSLLSAADGYVSNAYFEGWSVSASEALWCGLPVVLSDCGSARQLIGPSGERGLLVPNALGDPLAAGPEIVANPPAEAVEANRRALVEAMLDLVRNRPRWAEGAEERRGWARRELHPDRCVTAHARILGEAIESH